MTEDEPGGGASRSTDPAAGSSTGTDVSLREHLEALRAADLRFHEERDRRYAEVATEREKALKIKETADLAALGLAREIQTYKDEKANELRSQIDSERGTYVTRLELKPIAEWVTQQQGRQSGIGVSANAVVVAAGLVIAALGLYFGLS